MLAIIAAILFAIALIFNLAGTTFGTHISFDTFLVALLAGLKSLHLAYDRHRLEMAPVTSAERQR